MLAFARYDRLLETCSIALVGKYTKFSDSYASVIKALEHSALAINHKLEIKVRGLVQAQLEHGEGSYLWIEKCVMVHVDTQAAVMNPVSLGQA